VQQQHGGLPLDLQRKPGSGSPNPLGVSNLSL